MAIDNYSWFSLKMRFMFTKPIDQRMDERSRVHTEVIAPHLDGSFYAWFLTPPTVLSVRVRIDGVPNAF